MAPLVSGRVAARRTPLTAAVVRSPAVWISRASRCCCPTGLVVWVGSSSPDGQASAGPAIVTTAVGAARAVRVAARRGRTSLLVVGAVAGGGGLVRDGRYRALTP